MEYLGRVNVVAFWSNECHIGSHIEEIALDFDPNVRQVARLCQTSTHTKGLLELLESGVADTTLVEVDRLQISCRIALFLDHGCNGFCAPIADLIALQAKGYEPGWGRLGQLTGPRSHDFFTL